MPTIQENADDLPETIADAIEANARGPASVTAGGQSVSSKNIGELIEADRYLKGQQAKTRKGLGLRIQQITPRY